MLRIPVHFKRYADRVHFPAMVRYVEVILLQTKGLRWAIHGLTNIDTVLWLFSMIVSLMLASTF